MLKAVKRTLSDWARRERELLPERVQRLIDGANFDLHHGPHHEPGYPGFSRACDIISRYVPRGDLWLDIQAGVVLVGEPEPYVDGDEVIEPDWEDYAVVDAYTARKAILGDLAAYVN